MPKSLIYLFFKKVMHRLCTGYAQLYVGTFIGAFTERQTSLSCR